MEKPPLFANAVYKHRAAVGGKGALFDFTFLFKIRYEGKKTSATETAK